MDFVIKSADQDVDRQPAIESVADDPTGPSGRGPSCASRLRPSSPLIGLYSFAISMNGFKKKSEDRMEHSRVFILLRSISIATIGAIAMGACAQHPADHAPGSDARESRHGSFSFDEAEMSGPRPWTSENFENDPDNFQFAIIGDRTGGANAQGTFMLAMGQLNLLRPEFVINVGDIIEGYTRDKAELHAQWDEAEAMTRSLEMPFFYTRGNHDVSYPEAREVWHERHGPAYYHFVYRDVLFMVLDSEDAPRLDPPPGMEESIKLYNRLQTEDPEKARQMLAEFMKDESVVAGLSKPVEFTESQLDWIEETLAANPDARWTFVFTHEPCWENPSESFRSVQNLLKNRRFTWFAGHLHYYDYDAIDDREYITMGPAGASWHHDGPGNVDHITWVTMTEDDPQIGNIALKGVFGRKGLDPELFGAYDRKGAESHSDPSAGGTN